MQVKSAKDLTVYKRAYVRAIRIFELSRRFPAEERFALTNQVRRSSRSICLNLCEACASAAVAFANSAWQADRSGNRVFWDFIEEERNPVLRQYGPGFLAGPVDVVVGGGLHTLDDHFFCPITDGPFAGEDCRDVLEQAIGS
jgi:hypothetical protein